MKHNRCSFVGGLISGVIATIFLGCAAFAGVQLYQMAAANSKAADSDSKNEVSAVANVRTAKKNAGSGRCDRQIFFV